MNDGGESRTPALQCPLPLEQYPRVVLAHGGGGRLMQQLLERLILPLTHVPQPAHDAAVLASLGGRLALTSDAFVVHPLFFPGGDIGSLAVHGTLNDLAMAGAEPLYLTLALILEEGLELDVLWRVLRSLRAAADAAGVRLVAGDTKVVERGRGDGLVLAMTGIGRVPEGVDIGPARVQPGDAVLLSGDLGRHGIAVMAAREGLNFEPPVRSDSAPLTGLVQGLLAAGGVPHCLRDVTRGGLAAVLDEIAASAGGIEVDEAAIPVSAPVVAACELLGIDPLYVACEGRLVAFVPHSAQQAALAALRAHPLGRGAVCIGRVSGGAPRVLLRGRLGGLRVLDRPAGEQLPRIC